jgi:ATP synthase protein I
MIGGVLGGLGLGWFVDHVAHTTPFGLIGGLLIGTVGSVVSAVVSAVRMSERATANTQPAAPVASDEDDE